MLEAICFPQPTPVRGVSPLPHIRLSHIDSNEVPYIFAVGANGSGKSNFFHAIRFVLNVLTDSGATLRQEDRQRLLHVSCHLY